MGLPAGLVIRNCVELSINMLIWAVVGLHAALLIRVFAAMLAKSLTIQGCMLNCCSRSKCGWVLPC